MARLGSRVSEPEALLCAGARDLGLELDSMTVQKFLLYLAELQKWNTRLNLTGLKTATDIVHRHFLDSLAVAPWVQDLDCLLDLGTGAGFPGLPLKLVFPSLALTLVEATGKKIAFLEYLVIVLQLSGVAVRHCHLTPAQARTWGPGWPGVISRATFKLAQFISLAAPLLQPGGRLIALKGPDLPETEWQEAIEQASRLGLETPERCFYTLPLTGEPRQVILARRQIEP